MERHHALLLKSLRRCRYSGAVSTIVLKCLWVERFGERVREWVRHRAAGAAGVAHILEQVAAGAPRSVEAPSVVA